MCKKTPQSERITNIRRLAEKTGLGNIQINEISQKHGVHRNTTRKDIQKIYDLGIDKDAVKKAKLDLHEMNKDVINTLREELHNVTGKDKAKISNAIARIEETHIDFLEKFNIKEKVADPVDTQISVSWTDKKEKKKEDG